jgi:hypothetical protein
MHTVMMKMITDAQRHTFMASSIVEQITAKGLMKKPALFRATVPLKQKDHSHELEVKG